MLMEHETFTGPPAKTGGPYSWASGWATGVAHEKAAQPYQDASVVGTYTMADGATWFFSAVADGAGSSTYAAEAAALATEQFMCAITCLIGDGHTQDLATVMRAAATYARTYVLLWAEANDAQWKDVLTTLLAVVSDGTRVACLQVGDGLIVVRGLNGEGNRFVSHVFEPPHGEFANITEFLTEPEGDKLFQTHVFGGGITHAALVTDGIETLVLPIGSGTLVTPMFENIFEGLRQSHDIGDSQAVSKDVQATLDSDVFRSAHHDDMTLLAVQLRRD